MRITKERETDGVAQRDFELDVDGERVPGTLWRASAGPPADVLICMGHGGSQHKKTAGIRSRAREYAQRRGWATLAIDAPGHGDRISREEAVKRAREVGARVRGLGPARPFDAEQLRAMAARSQRAIPEWKAALDATLTSGLVDPVPRVGYWGVSMGTAIGVPFVASEPRIQCAVFGLAGLRAGANALADAAKQIAIPVQFVFQWDDAVASREGGIALFEAFSSIEKSMHINPGGHLGIPGFERDAWLAFYDRHLGSSVADESAGRSAKS